MKALFTICAIGWASIQLCAQQLPLFSQYRENQALLNPASISPNYWNQRNPYRNALGATYRRQWNHLAEGPVTMTLHYETLPSKFHNLLGINLLSDKTGPTGQNGGQLRYAYLLMDDQRNSRFLSLGLSLGYYQFYYHGDEIVFRDAGDAVGTQRLTAGQMDANLGVFYAAEMGDHDKIFYCGASILQLAGVSFDKGLKRTQHFYANIGMYKNLETDNEEDYFIEPSAWLRYVPETPVQLDLNCRFHTPHFFWVGLSQSFSFSTAGNGKAIKGNNLLFEVGTTLSRDTNLMRLGFGYQRSFTRFGADFGNTYEFNAAYVWQ